MFRSVRVVMVPTYFTMLSWDKLWSKLISDWRGWGGGVTWVSNSACIGLENGCGARGAGDGMRMATPASWLSLQHPNCAGRLA